MRIYLVRHGESEANVDRSVCQEKPDHAIELTEKGRRQARGAGEFLRQHFLDEVRAAKLLVPPPPRMWVSPYKRTRQTADGLIQGGFEPKDRREHIALAEQQFGLFDGVEDDQLPELFPSEYEHYKKAQDYEGRFWPRMPLGESRFDVALRVHQAFGTFIRDRDQNDIDTIVVVTHGVVIRAFVMMWLHLPFEWFERESNPPNASVRLIEGGKDKGYIYHGVEPAVESRTETI